MKVICINSGLHITKSGLVNTAKDFLVEGNEYNVVTVLENRLGEIGYILQEVRSPSLKGSFSATRFIPCSDKDETILINKIKQKV